MCALTDAPYGEKSCPDGYEDERKTASQEERGREEKSRIKVSCFNLCGVGLWTEDG